MRSVFALFLLFAVALALPVGGNCAPKKLKVLASTFPVYQIARNVAEGYKGVEVGLMIPAALGCPHDYALTPGDLRKIAEADLLVVNGLGLEEFLGAPVERAKPGMRVVVASEGIGGLLREEEGDHGGYNAHLFVSPVFSAAMAQNIARALAGADPKGAAVFAENARRYGERMKVLSAKAERTGAGLANNRIVTAHDAFDYLASEAGLKVVAVIDGHAGHSPGAAEMRALVAKIKEEKAGAVFYEPQYPSRVAMVIAREAGVPAASLDPAASGPEDAPLDWYDRVMEKNLQVLEKTLGVR